MIPVANPTRPPRIVGIRRPEEEHDPQEFIFDTMMTFENATEDQVRARLNFILTIAAQLGCQIDFSDGRMFDDPIFEERQAA